MRDEDAGVVPRSWGVAVMTSVMLLAGAGAGAQSLHGVGELQYQNLDQPGPGVRRETWVKSFQTDYSRRLPGAIELASRFRFTEQTVVGRPDRLRVPEGSLRLAHRNFGLSSAYRPTDTRDSQGKSLRQQNLTLTGYAQKPGLPSLAGSWIRTHLDPTEQTQGTATVTRSLSANYTRPGLALRSGYGDRLLEPDTAVGSRMVERHYNLGALSQFQIRGASTVAQYDFTQAWANPGGNRPQRSRSHTASLTSSYQATPKTSTSLSYLYRRTGILGVPGTLAQDHNGALSLSHTLTPVFTLSTGAGLRSAQFAGRTLTERFLNAGISAQAQARPGWQVGASAGRSYNWLPGTPRRTSDYLSSSTFMRLTTGLDARGTFSLSSTRRPEGTVDSLTQAREVGLQLGAGITARPLRSVYLDLNAQRSRAGSSTLRGSPTSTSYASSVRLTPTRSLQLGGGWSQTRGFGSRGSTAQATLLWTASARLQVSGSYNRARQRTVGPIEPTTSRQESFSGALTTALGRDTNASVRYSESNRNQPSHLRQVTVNLVRRFGR